MLINGMTIQEMANYLASLSSEQLSKLIENYSGFQVSSSDKLSTEASVLLAMILNTATFQIFSDEKLKEYATQDLKEADRCVLLAEMRKRHLI